MTAWKNEVTDVLREIGKEINHESVSWFDLHLNRFVETLNVLVFTVPKEALVLEVGSSPGYLTLAIKRLGYIVYGVDVSPDLLRNFLQGERIDVRLCDLEKDKIPFENEMFDGVLFTEILEHLNYYKINYVLSEVKRVMKPDGILILSTPNLAALENRLFLLKGGSMHLGGGIISPAHNREYTLPEVLNILQKNGFKIKKYWYSLARDIVTHTTRGALSSEHVLKGWIKHRHWINIGRAVAYPFKLAIPSFRSAMFVIASKPVQTYLPPV